MKTNNQNNYRLIKSCFLAFCKERGLKPYNNAVTWEHEGFSCIADDGEKDRCFLAVDACCAMCVDGSVDYCSACKCHNQIDFEEV